MEDVLDLYEEPYDPLYPTVCFDERYYQLLDHTRPPLPVEPGCPARVDYEYKRNGTCNLFAFFEPHRGWRHIRLTQQRTKLDVAECLRELVEQLYPHAKKISVVLDNLNVHTLWTLLRALSRGAGTEHCGSLGVPSHTGTRELAQHGRDRALCAGQTVPCTPLARHRHPFPGDRRMADRQEHHTAQAGLAIHRQRREDDDSQTLPPELTWPSTR